MIATFNSASFDAGFENDLEADSGFEQLLEVTLELKNECITNHVEYQGSKINLYSRVTKDRTIYDILNAWRHKGGKGREQSLYMITLLSRIQSCKCVPNPGKDITMEGTTFQIPQNDRDCMLLSLPSRERFRKPMLKGIQENGTDLELPNVAEREHIWDHRRLLGMRVYQPNPKHTAVSHAYGKGKVASPMQLNQEEAQTLLNQAIEVGDRLCAAKNGECYMFMNHYDIYYHGYLEEHPSDKTKLALGLK